MTQLFWKFSTHSEVPAPPGSQMYEAFLTAIMFRYTVLDSALLIIQQTFLRCFEYEEVVSRSWLEYPTHKFLSLSFWNLGIAARFMQGIVHELWTSVRYVIIVTIRPVQSSQSIFVPLTIVLFGFLPGETMMWVIIVKSAVLLNIFLAWTPLFD